MDKGCRDIKGDKGDAWGEKVGMRHIITVYIHIFILCSILPAQDDTLGKLKDKVSPAVVAIDVDRTADPDGVGSLKGRKTLTDYYRRPNTSVTGTIIEPDGYILTSYFNISGTIKKITVTTADGKVYEARILGFDQPKDIALLKIDAEGLPFLEPSEDKVQQGSFAAVIGRSPDVKSPTISDGMISATSRMKGTALQFDAMLNYGNVGGPLVDMEGRLLGITSHIKAKTNWGQSSGIGFATKISEINKILPALKEGKKIEKSKEPFIGIVPVDGEEDVEGVRIAQVIPNSPAEEAGLKEGDIIIELDGKKLADAYELQKEISSRKIGDEVRVKYKRGDEVKEVKMKLEEKP